MNDKARKVRHQLLQFYMKECRPPTVDELAAESGLNASDIHQILDQLEELHHIVKYKHESRSPTPIAMAHPFSHLPTPFVVSQGSRKWWANCMWCAMGLAAMLSPLETTITVRSGSIGTELQFTIRDDQVACTGDGDKIDVKNCHAHFSIPPVKWWKDVRFACGTIQIFPSKQEALEWPKKYGFYTGEIMTLENLWLLSKAWYHDKHTYEYERKTPAEVETLFNQLGMSSEFWKSR
ncbi:uncharacterized protein ATNIH1004_000186 [Aspergillus tanneri]|uniref:Uncharacterized protein n=1 Tax=Aspergillus tanneri TaxID=1220188 RepID=A0A5M9MW34_9EURO|nr:uncharacterized protein ATNIH1004_000186 [Aspergillus tanneri]KAA8651305.1 hypothetical protein ATNIH1004_000186 [Aspergillus tanneri]